jgi:hypothetical protein
MKREQRRSVVTEE